MILFRKQKHEGYKPRFGLLAWTARKPRLGLPLGNLGLDCQSKQYKIVMFSSTTWERYKTDRTRLQSAAYPKDLLTPSWNHTKSHLEPSQSSLKALRIQKPTWHHPDTTPTQSPPEAIPKPSQGSSEQTPRGQTQTQTPAQEMPSNVLYFLHIKMLNTQTHANSFFRD